MMISTTPSLLSLCNLCFRLLVLSLSISRHIPRPLTHPTSPLILLPYLLFPLLIFSFSSQASFSLISPLSTPLPPLKFSEMKVFKIMRKRETLLTLINNPFSLKIPPFRLCSFHLFNSEQSLPVSHPPPLTPSITPPHSCANHTPSANPLAPTRSCTSYTNLRNPAQSHTCGISPTLTRPCAITHLWHIPHPYTTLRYHTPVPQVQLIAYDTTPLPSHHDMSSPQLPTFANFHKAPPSAVSLPSQPS